MALGDFLVAYLRKIGVTHLFGIPGDLVLRLFLRFGARRGLRDRDAVARAGRRLRRRRLRARDGPHRRRVRHLRRGRPQHGEPGRRLVLRARAAPGAERRPGRGGAQARHADPPPGEGDRVAAPHLPRAHLRGAPARRSAHRRRDRARGGAGRSGASSGRATSRSIATWSSAASPCRASSIEWDGALALRALGRAQRRRGGARHGGALQRRPPARWSRSASRPTATSCSARSQRAGGAAWARRSRRPCSRRAPSRWTTRSTWASTSAPSRRRAILRRVDRADLVLNLGTLLTDMDLGLAAAADDPRPLDLGRRRPRQRELPHLHRRPHPRLRPRPAARPAAPPSRARALRRQPAARRPARRPSRSRWPTCCTR